MDFADAFNDIVDTLKSHAEVVVSGYELGKPATEDNVSAAIRSVGIEPSAEMLSFYCAHNGAFLEWGLKERSYQWVGSLGGYVDYGTPPGLINILPVEDAFSSFWQDEDMINPSIGGGTWNLAYGTDEPGDLPNAIVIDNFSNYHHTDMLLGPEPLLVVASDHGADLGCSDFVTFPQYLDLVISRFGTSPNAAIGIGWTREASRVQTIEKPSLNALIALIKQDEDQK